MIPYRSRRPQRRAGRHGGAAIGHHAAGSRREGESRSRHGPLRSGLSAIHLRNQLRILGRTFWARLPQIRDLPAETVQRIRAIIMECVGEIRRLPDPANPVRPAAGSLPLFDQCNERSGEPVADASPPKAEDEPRAPEPEPAKHSRFERSGSLFDYQGPAHEQTGFDPWSGGVQRQHVSRGKSPWKQRTLFDAPMSVPPVSEPEPAPSQDTTSPVAVMTPPVAEATAQVADPQNDTPTHRQR